MSNFRVRVTRILAAWAVLIVAGVFGVFACQKGVDLISKSVGQSVPKIEKRDYVEIASDETHSLEELKKAYPPQLLPSSETAPGGSGQLYESSGVSVSPDDAKNITETINGFLKEWETFAPGDDSLDSKISSFVFQDSDPTIGFRGEAGDAQGVCLEAVRCRMGTTWPDGTEPVLLLKEKGPGWVLVQGWGMVLYTGSDVDLVGRYASRRYGFLLEQRQGKWGLVRAVAETGRVI